MRLKNYLFLVILIIIVFLFNSCYEDYIIIETTYPAQELIDSNYIVFIHEMQASQPPKGISRFPDGGRHKIIYKNTTLYFYNLIDKTISEITFFGNLPYKSWYYDISGSDNKIFYSIKPRMGWEWRIKNSSNPDKYINLKKQLDGIFLYDLKNDENTRIVNSGSNPVISADRNTILYMKEDSLYKKLWLYQINTKENVFIYKTESSNNISSYSFYQDNSILIHENKDIFVLNKQGEKENIDEKSFKHKGPTKINLDSLFSNISHSEWGFELKKYWNKNLDNYCNDIILLHGNLEYRKTILEEFKNDLSVKDIERMLNKIEQRKQKLEHYEKAKYEYFSTETIEILKQLLEEKQ